MSPKTSHSLINAEERQVLNLLQAFMDKVVDDWGLSANFSELTSAIHVLQGFVVQHMLERVEPKEWSLWFKEG